MANEKPLNTHAVAGYTLGAAAVGLIAWAFWPKKAQAALSPVPSAVVPDLPPAPAVEFHDLTEDTSRIAVLVDGWDDVVPKEWQQAASPPGALWPAHADGSAVTLEQYAAQLGPAYKLTVDGSWTTPAKAEETLLLALKRPSERKDSSTGWDPGPGDYTRPKAGVLVDLAGNIVKFISSRPYRDHYVVAVFSQDGSDPPPVTRMADGYLVEWYAGYMTRINPDPSSANFLVNVRGPYAEKSPDMLLASTVAAVPSTELMKYASPQLAYLIGKYGAPKLVLDVDEYDRIVNVVACAPASC